MRWTLQLLPVSQLNINQSYLEITEIMNYIVKAFIYAAITLGLVACSQEDINSTEQQKVKEEKAESRKSEVQLVDKTLP